jgi:methionyl-tRNA formyltransferase
MLMDAGLDTGPILSQESIPIDLDITGGELAEELSILGANLLVETLPKYAEAELAPQNQDDKKATYAPMLKKKDGLLDFHKSAAFLGRQVRAYEPWPTSFLMWDTLRIVVRKAVPLPDASAAPGEVILKNGKPAVGTTDGALLLSVVQPAGRKRMPGDAFLNGSPDFQTANLLRDD